MTIFKPTDNLENGSIESRKEDIDVSRLVNYFEARVDIVLN